MIFPFKIAKSEKRKAKFRKRNNHFQNLFFTGIAIVRGFALNYFAFRFSLLASCFSLLAISLFTFFSCSQDYTPKPRGYCRIDLPRKEYRKFDTTFPFTFEYPEYSRIVRDSSRMAEPYWINILYLPFHAQLHISYKIIRDNLPQYLEDSRTLVNKHIPKANAIGQREFINGDEKVFGLIFDIRGSDAASTCQFYLTDSVARFVRGALYFNLVPNNDSLQPVIDYLKTDIEHMIATFRWKDVGKGVH